jgi:hypothetical protein
MNTALTFPAAPMGRSEGANAARQPKVTEEASKERGDLPVLTNLLQALRRRHYNPLSWAFGVLFAVALFLGVWYHDWWTIGIAIGALATCWFWFPEPASGDGFFAHAVKGQALWFRQRASWASLAHVLAFVAAFAGALIALWQNSLVLAVPLLGFVTLHRLWWVNERVRFSRLYDAWMNLEARGTEVGRLTSGRVVSLRTAGGGLHGNPLRSKTRVGASSRLFRH